jgi:hypothetical protein
MKARFGGFFRFQTMKGLSMEFVVEKVRHYCRNPRCRSKLAAPVSNPREAFCTRGCYNTWYFPPPSPPTRRGDSVGRARARCGSIAQLLLCPLQIVVLQRERADALAGCSKDRVAERRCHERWRRLANAAPESAARHDNALDFRRLSQSHMSILRINPDGNYR